MCFVRADDLEAVKAAYIEVIDNTPGMERHAHWVYGKHPSDEILLSYIRQGEMYVYREGGDIAGMVALVLSQGEDYESVSWQEKLRSDEVATLHLLAVRPAYRGKHLGLKILEEAMEVARKNGKRALRLDTLKCNIPARRMYERAGMSYRGEQNLYAENTGMMDFVYFEKIL